MGETLVPERQAPDGDNTLVCDCLEAGNRSFGEVPAECECQGTLRMKKLGQYPSSVRYREAENVPEKTPVSAADHRAGEQEDDLNGA